MKRENKRQRWALLLTISVRAVSRLSTPPSGIWHGRVPRQLEVACGALVVKRAEEVRGQTERRDGEVEEEGEHGAGVGRVELDGGVERGRVGGHGRLEGGVAAVGEGEVLDQVWVEGKGGYEEGRGVHVCAGWLGLGWVCGVWGRCSVGVRLSVSALCVRVRACGGARASTCVMQLSGVLDQL
jgi:hypothetical protein